jgi:hypothetical protein
LTKSGNGIGRRQHRLDVAARLRRGEHRQAGIPGGGDRPGLVPGQLQHLGGRPDEGDTCAGAGLGQVRVLRQEAVARIDRVGTGAARGAEDLLHREVGADGMAHLADLVALVGLEPVDGVAVLPREDRDRPGTQLVGSTERTDGDLTAVGHQHLVEHDDSPSHTGAALQPDLAKALRGDAAGEPCWVSVRRRLLGETACTIPSANRSAARTR